MAKWTDLGLTYDAALHGMQSAVAHEMGLAAGKGDRHPGTEPKHLRVGINSAMAEHAGLAFLLIDKGIITEEEYIEAMRQSMNHELAHYEADHHPIKFR